MMRAMISIDDIVIGNVHGTECAGFLIHGILITHKTSPFKINFYRFP
jgi:hypothetical protein